MKPLPDEDFFGIYLRRERKHQGLTQENLAHKAGIPRTHIVHMERGNILWPRFDTALDLIDALKVTCEHFMRPL